MSARCDRCREPLVCGACPFCAAGSDSDAPPWALEWREEFSLVGGDEAAIACDDEGDGWLASRVQAAVDWMLAADACGLRVAL